MNQANKEFLEKHRHVYLEIINAGTAKKANQVKDELLRVLREEFIKGYVYTEDCGTCIFDMTKLLYRRFDEWLATNPDPVEPINPVTEPITVAASFPSNILEEKPKTNKKHHRK